MPGRGCGDRLKDGVPDFKLEMWPANWLRYIDWPPKGVCFVIKSLPLAFLHQIVASAGSGSDLAAQRLHLYAAQQDDLDIHLQVSGRAGVCR